MLDQIRRKWIRLGHMLRRNDDSITKQALQWTPQGHRGRGRPTNTWRRDLEKEMWTDSKIQVQLEEDGGGSTRQSWMETSGL